MTDKVQKIREEVERLKSNLIHGACASQIAMETRCKEEAYNEVLAILDTMQENQELSEKEQKVANVYSRKLKDKRLLPTLKGDLKHKFLNEFNTLYQTLDMQLCDRCMKEPLKDLCLAFAAWGAYNLKNYFGMSDEEKAKMDSMQEEPKTDWLQELKEKLDSLSKEDFKKVWAKYSRYSEEEPVSMWHDVSEEPKPNMELICVGQYGNPLVLSSNSILFKERYISKWAYFNDLLNLSNVQRTGKDWKEEIKQQIMRNIVDKACKFLDYHLTDYWGQINANNTEGFINDFRKTLEV